MPESSTTPRKRANGIAAREKILDAAVLIATERGYEGTSMALVSKRSGLPASSIYWHFKNKDDLIAAVIERSFGDWLQALTEVAPPPEGHSEEDFVAFQAAQLTHSLEAAPDFLRLGLMLALEHHPEDPTARRTFLEVRSQAMANSVASYARAFPEFDQQELEQLASFTIALADGFFVSRQVDDAAHDLLGRQDLYQAAVLGVVRMLRNKSVQA
ncbi:MAG: TetR/AcrR family transcriptional regulator [Pseudomonadota bacterium]